MVLNGKVEENTYSDVNVKEMIALLTQATGGIPNLDTAVLRFTLPGGMTDAVTIRIETFKDGLPRITFIPVCGDQMPKGDTPVEKGAVPKINSATV